MNPNPSKETDKACGEKNPLNPYMHTLPFDPSFIEPSSQTREVLTSR